MEKYGFQRHLYRLLLAICILPLVLLGLGVLLPPQYSGTYLGEMPEKQQRLTTASGKRIIVIGGSSVPFSLNSELLERLLPGWTVVDYGLYAQLGTVTMLDWAKESIRQGDLVILSPEQDAQALSCFADGESILQACDGNFGMLPQLKPVRMAAVAAAFPAFAGKKLHYAIFGAPQSADIYTRAAFNERGDIADPRRERNILPGGFQPNQPIRFEGDMLSPDFLAEVNAFASTAREKGADVVYHFPPMNEAALSAGAEPGKIDWYYDRLASMLEMPIIGSPHSCILESGWFYDSNFHLNASGSLVFSRLLAEDIKVYLRDSSKTDVTLPAMPAPLETAFSGDDSCEKFFTYLETENGWCITGVTEAGKQQSRLILPTRHADRPVTGVGEKALHGCTKLQTLTVQPNISVLWDDLLAGCISLKRIILTAETPSAYSVGDNLMGGGTFLIQVPQNALDSYRRSYFWQKYEPWLTA